MDTYSISENQTMKRTLWGSSSQVRFTDFRALEARINQVRAELGEYKRESERLEARIWELERRFDRLQSDARAMRNAEHGD